MSEEYGYTNMDVDRVGYKVKLAIGLTWCIFVTVVIGMLAKSEHMLETTHHDMQNMREQQENMMGHIMELKNDTGLIKVYKHQFDRMIRFAKDICELNPEYRPYCDILQ